MKKLLILTAAIACIGLVRADVLYWMVGDQYADDAKARGDSEAASLYAVYDGTATKIDTVTGNDVAEWYGVSSFDTQLGTHAGNGYSYYVELWNGNQSEEVSYASALQNGYITTTGMSTPSPAGMAGGVGSGSQTYAVPEPTSGLLFVIGGMLLGLKRKRQV
jgi:hypothetical protein